VGVETKRNAMAAIALSRTAAYNINQGTNSEANVNTIRGGRDY
jgi:hypothetical protein